VKHQIIIAIGKQRAYAMRMYAARFASNDAQSIDHVHAARTFQGQVVDKVYLERGDAPAKHKVQPLGFREGIRRKSHRAVVWGSDPSLSRRP
jgi:hypothetical protein